MKRIALALTVLTALALPLVAQDAPKPAKKPSVPNTSASPTEGRIGYISDKKIAIRAKGADVSASFKLDAETKVTVNGESKAVTDLKKGWTAKVTPKTTDLESAASVEVTKTESAAPKEAKPEANE